MSRRHKTQAVLGDRTGDLTCLVQDALADTKLPFSFASDEDRARVRRQIKAAVFNGATDRQLLKVATILWVKL